MSHHILEKDPLNLDHQLSETQPLRSTTMTDSPPHIASPSSSPFLNNPSRVFEPDTQERPAPDHDLTLPQTGTESTTSSDATAKLELGPRSLVADPDRRATAETDEESESDTNLQQGLKSPKPEDEDFYDSQKSIGGASTITPGYLSDSSSVPLFHDHRPEVQTSPAPEGCDCGLPWHSPPSPAKASSPRFLSEHNSPGAVSPTHSFPADLRNETLPAETYAPRGEQSAVSSTNNSGLWSGATPSTLPPIPPAPVNSPHDELTELNSPESRTPAEDEGSANAQSYTGPPGSSKDWPHYYTPVVEREGDVKCYGKIDPATGEATEFEHKTTLPRSQSSGWLEGVLDRQKNASLSSIHANGKDIDDVKRCPAALDGTQGSASPQNDQQRPDAQAEESGNEGPKKAAARQRKVATGADPELQNWIAKRNMMVHELRQIDTQHPAYRGPNPPMVMPRTNSRTRRGQVQDAEELLNAMHERGFQPTPDWEAEHDRLLKLAKKVTAYPFLAFALAEFGEFLNLRFARADGYDGTAASSHLYQHAATDAQQQGGEAAASERAPAHGPSQSDLNMATRQGTIDGCEAGMRLMAIVGSRPSRAWREQYEVLAKNAREDGELEPLIELVRPESETVCKLNASTRAARAAEASASGTRAYGPDLDRVEDADNLTETSVDNDPSDSVSEDEGYRAYQNELHVLQLRGSTEYSAWLTNTMTVADFTNEGVFWMANPRIQRPTPLPRLSMPDECVTEKPFQVILGAITDDHGFEPRFGFYALAVRITMSENAESCFLYADVRMQDKEYHERLFHPVRVQCFGVLGGVYDIDLAAITAEMDDIRKESKGKQPIRRKRARQTNRAEGRQTSSSDSGTIVRRQASEVYPSAVGSSDIHLTTAETRALHPSVFSDRGMTLVPQEDFPAIPADPYGLLQYQLQVGQPPSTVFVNCERCLKMLASFENVEGGPTVARRAEGESGDAYIVTAISSLNNIIDSVDRVKRVWVRVGTEKYFMRANEAGGLRAHESVSAEETVRVELHQDQKLTRYHSARMERRRGGYDRLGDLATHNYPIRQPHSPPQEPAQQAQGPTIRMPPSMQFIPMQNFPTAELTGNPPCTIIAVNERSGIIHGVYQGVLAYRAIFRGAREAGDTITLHIRDGLGHLVGNLTRVRYIEVAIIDGQTHEFTAPEQPGVTLNLNGRSVPTTAEMNAHPPCLVTSICERSKIIHGVYQGVTGYRCTFRPAGEHGDTVSLDVRDPFGAFLGKLTRVRHYEVAIMNGEIAGFTAQDEVVELPATQTQGEAHQNGTRTRGDAAVNGGSIAPQDGALEDSSDSDSDPEFALRGGAGDEDEESSDGERPMMRAARTDWVVPTETSPVAPLNPQALEFTPQNATEPQEEQVVLPSLHAIEQPTAGTYQHPNQNSVGADRIPSFLQRTSSMGPATNDEEPVLSEEYKEWLRGMYTRPSNYGCATNTAPGPSFQDSLTDGEAGRPATAADRSITKPEPKTVHYDADIGEVKTEYIALGSDDDDEGLMGTRHVGHGVGTAEDPIVLSDNEPQIQTRPHTAQPTAPNPQVVWILERFLHEQAVKKAREAFEAAVRGD